VSSERHDTGRGLWLGKSAGFEQFMDQFPVDMWPYGSNSVIESLFVG